MTNPDKPCPHENFQSIVGVHRLTEDEGGPIVGYAAEVRTWCADCQEDFIWIGCNPGLSPRGPRVSVDQKELRIPLKPASADLNFGGGLPGFDIKVK